MKNLTFFFVAIVLGVTVFAQAPESSRYQAVARDNSGNVLANQNVSFRISILSGSVSGNTAYSETHTSISTNAFGLVELEIGKGTPVNGTFSSIDWGGNSYFVKIEMDPSGGTTYLVRSISQLLSVPYALHAKTAENGITTAQATKLEGIAAGAEVNVNADWNATTGDALILNKPNLTVYATKNMAGQSITNLANPANAQDAATKAYVEKLLKDLGLIANNYAGTMVDIQGNVYKTVQIGSQVWMAENLRVAKLKDGTAIPLVTDNTAWGNLLTPGYCWYNNDKATYGNIYGALYNWYTVNTGKLCPTGWHVSSDAEWTTLTTFLVGGSVAGGRMKEAGTTHWLSPNTGATNESGFSGLPGGYRYEGGGFVSMGIHGLWWSSNESSISSAWYRYLYYNSYNDYHGSYGKGGGLSVRCVRDF